MHPFRERRRAANGAVAAVAGAGALVYLATGSLMWGVVGSVVLVLSLNRFFWASRFEIDGEGITARYPFGVKRRKWGQVKRFAHDETGGILSPFARSSRLDSWRAMQVYFGSHGDEVVRRIDRLVGVEEQ